jgi:hypothetical protein
MPKRPPEVQRRWSAIYYARHFKGPDRDSAQLTVQVSLEVKEALDRLAACYDGWTKRSIITKLIRDEERVALRRAGHWKGGKAAYRDGTLQMDMQTRRELLKEEHRAAARELARRKAEWEAAEDAERTARYRAAREARERGLGGARAQAPGAGAGAALWLSVGAVSLAPPTWRGILSARCL